MYHLLIYEKTKRHPVRRRGALLTSSADSVLEGLDRQEEHGRLLAGLDEQLPAEDLEAGRLATRRGVLDARAAARHTLELAELHLRVAVDPVRAALLLPPELTAAGAATLHLEDSHVSPPLETARNCAVSLLFLRYHRIVILSICLCYFESLKPQYAIYPATATAIQLTPIGTTHPATYASSPESTRHRCNRAMIRKIALVADKYVF